MRGMQNPKRIRDRDRSADPDYIGFRRHTYTAEIDVIIACGEIRAGAESQCDVEAPVLLAKHPTPTAVFNLPVVLPFSAAKPMAVLSLPVVLLCSATAPVAVFSNPVVLEINVSRPLAVLRAPVV